jgi:hypothetical protein
MAELIIHKTFHDFIAYNEEYLFDNYIGHYNVIKTIENRDKTGIKINSAFNIIDDHGAFVLAFLYDRINFSIYGTNWNSDVVSVFSKFANLSTAPAGIHFTGERQLVLDIAAFNKLSYDIFKDRLIYACDQTNEALSYPAGEFGLAEKSDISIMSAMSYAFHVEEYKEHAFRKPEEMEPIIRNGIEAETFFKWSLNGNIKSIAQVMSASTGYPIIGHFFTDQGCRNRGYGTALIFNLTDLILNGGYEKCGLISDVASIASNKVFQTVGYNVIYKTIAITTS